MKNISNLEIDSEKCTKCSNCGKPSWYVMICDCGKEFCRRCSAPSEDDSDIVNLICPDCGEWEMFV